MADPGNAAPAGESVASSIRRALADGGDPARAEQQQRYMKSALPFHGWSSPELKAVLRPILTVYVPADRAAWERDVRDLWHQATYREERYAALAIARHRRARGWLDVEALPLLRHLVVTGAWWDVVDDVATHLVRDARLADPDRVTPVLESWLVAEDLWLRRTAVLCQVGAKDRTDRDLLRRAVEANLDDTSWWLRKAIGWALRDFARTDPAWVWGEVDRLGDRMSGLSHREATRHR